MNVWRLITHNKDRVRSLDWSKNNSRITIGWGDIGDIGKKGYNSPQDINVEIFKSWPEEHSTHGGPSLWRFYKWMQKGDLVILKTNRFEAVIEVTGDYEWNNAPLMVNGTPLNGEHYHQRRVAFTNRDPEKLWKGVGRMAPKENPQFTLLLCGQNPLGSSSP